MELNDANNEEIQIEKGLYFILSHLEKPIIFPRKISTQKSQNKQFSIKNKEEIIKSFNNSNFIDCRINAFPSLKEGALWTPDLLFLDLDLADFKSKKTLQLALNKTLKTIREKLDNGHPSVLWSGNGYHIILPVYCPKELEHIQEFQEFNNPSEGFLRFAKDVLSNNKADKRNYPSFRSCLLRIPFSLNSKCLIKGYNLEKSKVKIVQEWDGYRPPIKELLYDFRRYLIDQKIKDWQIQQKNTKRSSYHIYNNRNTIWWIELLLKIPIRDFRKNATNLILAPYLINIKKISYQESFEILIEWLKKCDLLSKLDFNPKFLVKSSLNVTSKKGIPPMKFETLKNRNLELYLKLNEQCY